MFCHYQYISALGQLLDIVGVIILFFTGLPYKFPKLTGYSVVEPEDKDLPSKDKIQKRHAYTGLTIILIGFILQLLGTMLSLT